MGTTTANMSLQVPTLNGDPGTWDTQLSASLALIDLHDHTAGKGVRIPTAGLNINADLTMAGYQFTNLKGATFTAQASDLTGPALYVKGVDLYFRDGSANVIRFSASGSINIATTGGIAGDYISGAAQVYYDQAAKTYRFLDAATPPNVWSYMASASVDIYEKGSGITNRVRLSSPAALAASYEVTFPAALPGSTLLTQVSSAGVMTWSNTIANAVSMSSTLGVTGLITATAGLTAAANQHVTVSGTGEFKHGSYVMNVSPFAGYDAATSSPGVGYVVSSANGIRYIPIPLKAGDRITDAQYSIYGDGAADVTIEVVHYTGSNVRTVLGTVTKTNEAAAWTTYSLGVTDTTLSANDQVLFEFAYNAANIRIGGCSATYTRP